MDDYRKRFLLQDLVARAHDRQIHEMPKSHDLDKLGAVAVPVRDGGSHGRRW